MDTWLLIVSISAGIITVGTLLVKVSKVIEALNKKCPCPAVCELQEKTDKYDEVLTIVMRVVKDVEQLQEVTGAYSEYFSNDSRAIKELGARLTGVEVEVKCINKTTERMDTNVLRLLENMAFK